MTYGDPSRVYGLAGEPKHVLSSLFPMPYYYPVLSDLELKYPYRTHASKEVADVGFHFNPRFDEGPVVVRNARIAGSWAEEVRSSEAEFPFAYKEDFCVVIEAHEECYKVVVNGKHFTDFPYRIPLESISHLCIKGHVKIFSVHFPLPLPSRLIASIPGNLKIGDIVNLNGKVSDGCSGFKVNFQCGESDSDDIVMHINPRFDTGEVVRNSRQAEEWGAEESDGGMPFSGGNDFDFTIATLADRFQMFVNGAHFANFVHRVPLGTACTMLIDGSIELVSVIIESPSPKFLPPTGDKIKPENILIQEFNPLVPVALSIPSGMKPGRIIIIIGTVNNNAEKLVVNLQHGDADDADICYHFNPRFGSSQIVQNNRFEGSWGSEDTNASAFVFEKGGNFNLVLKEEPGTYAAYVNGQQVCEFSQRIDSSLADHLVIRGGVFIKRIIIA